MANELTQAKAALRATQKARRAAIDAADKAMADAALCAQAATLPVFRDAELILGFYPMAGEVDLRPLYDLALQQGKAIAFPRCEGTRMTFHRVASLAALTPGRFGILTPPADAPVAVPTASTLCLLPALAATKDGARLGYGGGFYDRFLQSSPCRTLLPIYHALLVATLPCEPTDIFAEIILTEKGVLC